MPSAGLVLSNRSMALTFLASRSAALIPSGNHSKFAIALTLTTSTWLPLLVAKRSGLISRCATNRPVIDQSASFSAGTGLDLRAISTDVGTMPTRVKLNQFYSPWGCLI